MVDVAKVKMFGMNVGTFRWDSSYEVARFEYDAQFAGKGIEPSPLMMPVQQGRISVSYTHLTLPTKLEV